MDQKLDGKRTDEHGVFVVGVESIASASEKTLRACFHVVRDARGELVQRVMGALDWIESLEQGGLRLARTVVQRTDEVATAWIDAQERLAFGVLRAARTTSEGATDLASQTAASLIGTHRDREIVAQA